jgi:hypothetical protein
MAIPLDVLEELTEDSGLRLVNEGHHYHLRPKSMLVPFPSEEE